MIIDSSALIAILRNESEAQRFSELLETDERPKMSVVSYVEAAIVADGAKSPLISRNYDDLILVADIDIITVTVEQGRLAREAYRDFGRGSGHPAKLNFGDCFSYALAKDFREPLLFKGTDFPATDVEPAAP